MSVSNMARRRSGSMATAIVLCALCIATGVPSALGTKQPENWDWFPGFGGHGEPPSDPFTPPVDESPPLFPAPEYPPDGGSPPYDGGSPPFDGGSPPFDGGSPPFYSPPIDGGSPPFDGGSPPYYSPPIDGGSPPFDGGSPPFDGGSPPFDGGSPPFDGGSPPFDGGSPPYYSPPFDGGSPPFDGGSPPYYSPPFDGGSPPYDGGSPPYYSPPIDGSSPPYYVDPPTYPVDPPSEEPIPWASGCTASYWASTAEKWPEMYKEDTTVVDAFGKEAAAHSGKMTLFDALLTTHTDGFSALMKHGTAALFNSHKMGFQYTTDEVKSMFLGALSSEETAGVQAVKFENANKGYNF